MVTNLADRHQRLLIYSGSIPRPLGRKLAESLQIEERG